MSTYTHPYPLPTTEEAEAAREGGRTLSTLLRTKAKTQQIKIVDDQGASHPVRIPSAAMRLLVDVLAEIGSGNAVSITPVHAELTTQEAADLLNISRPHLVQIVEGGGIPFRKIGTHRRVRYQDVMTYKQKIDAKRRQALDELAAQAQELNMGYE